MCTPKTLCGAAVLLTPFFAAPAYADYGHGCARFAGSDLSPGHVRQLQAAGHCGTPTAHAGGRIKMVTRSHTETRILERGVSDGSSHSQDRLTSMGRAESDGANVMRIRSTQSQTVSLRRVGGDTKTLAVEPGDTIVEVDEGGTYVADFAGTGARQTKSTGTHTWDDVKEETIVTQERIDVESGADTR